jgi:hypothetical protein
MSEWMSVNVPMNSKKEKGQRAAITNFPEIEKLEKDGWQVAATLGGDFHMMGIGGTTAIVFVLKRE